MILENPITNYIIYPFTLISHSNAADFVVGSEFDCAYYCNNKFKKCRSFNLCNIEGSDKLGCYLSEKNIFNIHENSASNAINCSHYSSMH